MQRSNAPSAKNNNNNNPVQVAADRSRKRRNDKVIRNDSESGVESAAMSSNVKTLASLPPVKARKLESATQHGLDAHNIEGDELEAAEKDIIWINHRGGMSARMTSLPDMLTQFPIILFGEGNFTFSIALANIRGSWDEITATCLENSVPEYNVALQIVQDCRRFVPKDDVPAPKEGVWMSDVDATDFEVEDDEERKKRKKPMVFWFQCPWISIAIGRNETATLIKDFIKCAASQQRPGDYLCIGITFVFPYVTNYDLNGLLGVQGEEIEGVFSDTALTSQLGYEFLGANQEYAKRLLDHGYKHTGEIDIHDDIKKFHLTLVFRNQRW